MHNFIIGLSQSRSRPLIPLPDFRIRRATVLRRFFSYFAKIKAATRCGKRNRCAEAPTRSRIHHPISSLQQHFSSINRRSGHL
ncbi:LOW QUALITY PROTEIN: uncharacterized protein Dere_GG13503 [Drosophila erecta]|uniref:Uncharacterized protein n=1 Tax=Drosophila erecta TaxID=7220 RepID=A0A0Q5U7K7_DROER|nr:LOW QUALITY PROTEIN: uncharacterized protein Dere_GG13503 [Drosophila erecta]